MSAIGVVRGRLLLCGALGLVAPSLGGCAGPGPRPADSAELAVGAEAEALGIKLLEVRRSAAGYMLDLRYQVTDAEKAAPLLDKQIRPYLVDQVTGARLFVPSGNLGPLRQTGGKPVPGRTYFALFANPGKYVEAGRKVTLVLGERRVRDLTVLE